jgi:hypothetical protein
VVAGAAAHVAVDVIASLVSAPASIDPSNSLVKPLVTTLMMPPTAWVP